MQQVSECFEEHHKRWHRISQLCGFHITSPGFKSPTSHSPKQETLGSHGVMRFTNRSLILQHNPPQLSEVIHSLHQQSSQPNLLPGRDRVLQGQAFGLPQSTKFKKRHSIPVIPEDSTSINNNSIESTSSSASSSSAPQIPTRGGGGGGGGGGGEGEELILQSMHSDVVRARNFRGSSVDTWKAAMQSGEKPVAAPLDRKKQSSIISERAPSSSPQDSPHSQKKLRNRTKQVSTNV